MTRRCSHCSNNGHNSRTCPTRGGGACGGVGGAAAVKLFGVRLTDGSIIKKSASMGNLSALTAAAAAAHCHHSPSSSATSPNRDSPLSDHVRDPTHPTDAYLSDDPAHRRGDRKKGVPWSEEEHRLFLIGLQKLGKGDWRGISRNYVFSRTPTQVASHAQKFFIRHSNSTRRKRRSSLFDMVTGEMVTDSSPVQESQILQLSPSPKEPEKTSSQPSLDLSLKTAECEPLSTVLPEQRTEEPEDENNRTPNTLSPVGFFPSYYPVTYTFWPTSTPTYPIVGTSQHQILKPIPGFAKKPIKVDELVGMSNLSIAAERGQREPSPLSLKLIGEPSRPSAFHTNGSVEQCNSVIQT